MQSAATMEGSGDRSRLWINLRQHIGFAGLLCLMLFVCAVYSVSNPLPSDAFDYQFRIARAMMEGKLGLDQPVPWLNELVPYNGKYYSVFPLGSVLCAFPAAVVQKFRGYPQFPAREVIAWTAGVVTLFLVMLSRRYGDPRSRRLILILLTMFGTWIWCNLVLGGAWQFALAGAMLGQFGALAFTLNNRQPFLAGVCFAIAFGNRTEVLLTFPLFLYLLLRSDPYRDSPLDMQKATLTEWFHRVRNDARSIVAFAVVPLLLTVATLWYNGARFGNPLDFGYSRIPNLLNDDWYRYGFFSLHAIPINAHYMILNSSWDPLPDWPFMRPRPAGGSIFSSCPYLFLLMRNQSRDRELQTVCWIAISLLTMALWLHGNPGGWQFSYRYATVLIPWIFLILLDQRGGKVTFLEGLLFALSVVANIWAVYLFCWTNLVN